MAQQIWVRIDKAAGTSFVDISKAIWLGVEQGKSDNTDWWHINAEFPHTGVEGETVAFTIATFTKEELANNYLESLMKCFPLVMQLRGGKSEKAV